MKVSKYVLISVDEDEILDTLKEEYSDEGLVEFILRLNYEKCSSGFTKLLLQCLEDEYKDMSK